MDPDDLVTEGEIGPDESLAEYSAETPPSPVSDTRSELQIIRLSPAYQRLVNVSYTIAIVILLAHCFEALWIAGRYLPNTEKMPPFDTPRPPVYYITLYSLPVIAWILHYRDMLRDGREQGMNPPDRISYHAGPASWRIKGFWVLAMTVYLVELIHDVGYMGSPTTIGGDSQYTWSIGLIISLSVRIALVSCLLVFGLVVDVYVRNLRARGAFFVDPETAGQPGETPIPDLYKPPTTFGEFAAHFRKLLPFIWPKGKHAVKLQLMILACFALLVVGRVINLLVPLQYKRVVDSLGGAFGFGDAQPDRPPTDGLPDKIPYGDILLFVLLRFLSGGVGLLNTLQSYLWIPVGQVRYPASVPCLLPHAYTTLLQSIRPARSLSGCLSTCTSMSFSQRSTLLVTVYLISCHSLSLRFHLNRKTGEILRVQGWSILS